MQRKIGVPGVRIMKASPILTRIKHGAVAAIMFAGCGFAGAAQASSSSNFGGLQFLNPTATCQSDCAFSVYSGRYLETGMNQVFGLKGFVAPNNWKWGDSGFVGATFSRPVLRYEDLFVVEVEIGAGKRFGVLSSPEVWGAVYFRWTWFPWNHLIRTSVAVSTGLNYAFKREAIENVRTDNFGRGSHLLHFLSPEITFGLPKYPNIDVFLRLHHRSGGGKIFGPVAIFNGAGGGAQFGVVGARMRF